MIYDYTHNCKTYDAKSYTKSFFDKTRCPKCRAIGRFNLHGSYERHVAYFNAGKLVYTLIKIKRVMCKSCGTTHAVLPIDIIAYRLLSLFVMMSIFFGLYIKKIPILQIAAKLQLSFQFVYSCRDAFSRYINLIHQFFKQTSPRQTAIMAEPNRLLPLMREAALFQRSFIKMNQRPCFMCKFFAYGSGPPIGILTSPYASKP